MMAYRKHSSVNLIITINTAEEYGILKSAMLQHKTISSLNFLDHIISSLENSTLKISNSDYI